MMKEYICKTLSCHAYAKMKTFCKKENEWKDAITSENLSWTNVSTLAGWDSESTDTYYVSSTPTFFLVDNKQTIVGKPDGYNEVARMIDNLLL